ncbi:hypothetical protein TBLA_0I02160 [Henningerozyma blattae CBS 6284]|uniref:Uncharacterized protein n=1 Tax=Henningerozyma blattae (strain ATCC 34711 / CBS 6284 / DSM 70876 / NBRC 10599 / NRRL Y-10934 / UCD 77-7) TaxID=1071380 RepID=I2H922_HENB6|nr:hypothetical protein TBLA_0I02160 [Tetrapisispora blattae CBS 6284]CCH62874.1 hypothetical protein TBLA_0I02160 [Tetrapisispora blattae CBS 6284]
MLSRNHLKLNYSSSINLSAKSFLWKRQYKILSGKLLAKSIVNELNEEVKKFKSIRQDFLPKLQIFQVGSREDSTSYIKMKLKIAKECGIDCSVKKMPSTISEMELIREIKKANNNVNIHGILVQLPLPSHFSESSISNSISPMKDIDGLNSYNIGELAKRDGQPWFTPCTPKGCIELLKSANITLEGKDIVVIGRSNIVGNPMANLLKNHNATVTVCHLQTKDLKKHTKRADIIISAAGCAHLIQKGHIKKDAIVIDVGINFIYNKQNPLKKKLVGDTDFEKVKNKTSYITPVPGGVGPMTICMLAKNVIEACKLKFQIEETKPKITPLKLELKCPLDEDIEISRQQEPKEIISLAEELGIKNNELEIHGNYMAKVSSSITDRLKYRSNGHYVLVCGITPTQFGEGKSTTAIGLGQAFTSHLGIPSIVNIRQSSMGPTFGMKGGAAGGGYSQVIPMDLFNLHLTGDIHAITAANNLLAAAIDTRIFHETRITDDLKLYLKLVPEHNDKRYFKSFMLRRLQRLGVKKTDPNFLNDEEIRAFSRLNIDPNTITINRTVDANDRMLRGITIGESPTEKGLTRETRFDITAASELMAIVTLSNDLHDMKNRISNMVIGFNFNNKPITVDDLGLTGSLTAILKNSLKPTLMQTLEGTPAMVHTGPFANISIGSSSVIADKIGLKLVGRDEKLYPNKPLGYVITEAGFDFSMGGERFLDVKCRSSELTPDAVVIVTTVRGLKLHGGAPTIKPDEHLPSEYLKEDVELVSLGTSNLCKQIQNAIQFNIPVIVAINKFSGDTQSEFDVIKEAALLAGAKSVQIINNWEKGGEGSINLASSINEVVKSEKKAELKYLYDLSSSIEDKLIRIVQTQYGGKDIILSELAQKKMAQFTKLGYDRLPICIAKTQYSLSHDPKLKGIPKDFIFPIIDLRLSAGAKYLYAIAGKIQTMPGLPVHAAYMSIEVDEDGLIQGLK